MTQYKTHTYLSTSASDLIIIHLSRSDVAEPRYEDTRIQKFEFLLCHALYWEIIQINYFLFNFNINHQVTDEEWDKRKQMEIKKLVKV